MEGFRTTFEQPSFFFGVGPPKRVEVSSFGSPVKPPQISWGTGKRGTGSFKKRPKGHVFRGRQISGNMGELLVMSVETIATVSPKRKINRGGTREPFWLVSFGLPTDRGELQFCNLKGLFGSGLVVLTVKGNQQEIHHFGSPTPPPPPPARRPLLSRRRPRRGRAAAAAAVSRAAKGGDA